MFKLIVRQDGAQVEEYDRATVTRGKQNIATMVNPQSKVIRIEDTNAGPNEKPALGTVGLQAPPAPTPVQQPSLNAEDYVGDVADRTGFGGLEAIDEITMVCVPDLMSATSRAPLTVTPSKQSSSA